MWMKHDQNKENTTGRPNEGGILRCPMCKGRGYFEPNQVSNTKTSDCFYNETTETKPNNSIKLPRLEANPSKKKVQKPKNKFCLPSINNVKNLPEHNKNIDFVETHNEGPVKKDKHGDLGSGEGFKPNSRTQTGKSQRLSVASSNESNVDKNLIPSPRTPRNPMETLKTSLMKLKSSNWNDALQALKDLVQLSRYQPRLLESSMVVVYRGLIHLLKSLRSVVVRTACQASNELFATMANTQRPEFDELVNVLLQKTADTNKSIRQDANEALDTMVINIPSSHSVRTIAQKGIPHKSPHVRGASARLLVCTVGVVGVESIYTGNKETRGRVLNAAASCMQDGCQEVRNYGKRLMKMLMQHDDFEDVLQNEVNEILLKRIEKSLITMKYKT